MATDLEQRRMLADTAERLFADATRSADVDAAGFDAALWAQAVELGLPSLLLPEDQGGAGGDWEDACVVLQAMGFHGVPIPLAEHLVAAQLVAQAGLATPGMAADDPTAILGIATTDTVDGRFSAAERRFEGRLVSVPWGRHAKAVVALQPDRADGVPLLLRCEGIEVEPHLNPAGEPRDTLVGRGAPCTIGDAGGARGLALDDRLAAARCAQIAGALRAALERSVGYAGTRKQFGRAIGQFQAVQQLLAQFGTEVAAASAAATAACRALSRLGDGGVPADDARFAIGAAKLRCNLAIGVGTATAHQVHAAIGFTHEYDLRRATQRLWCWRSEGGNDRTWADRLGRAVCARGAENFWADLTARDDAASAPRAETSS